MMSHIFLKETLTLRHHVAEEPVLTLESVFEKSEEICELAVIPA